MAYPDIATKEDLANELFARSKDVEQLEDLFRHADAVLTAVRSTDLLDIRPETEEQGEKLRAAVMLLADLQRKLRAYEDREGTDVSISLHVLASDIAKGRFAHRRQLEEL